MINTELNIKEKELKDTLHAEFKVPDYPFLDTLNNQLIGHTSECKHCFQCGYIKALCTNTKNPSKFCFWGWYTAGLLPDSLCPFVEINPKWKSASTNYFINRKLLVDNMIENKEVNENKEIPNEALRLDGAGEYIYKPVNIFLLGGDETATIEKIKEQWPWLDGGVGKPIYKIRCDENEDIENVREDLRNRISSVPNVGIVPSMILKWKELPDVYYQEVMKIISDYESVQTVNVATRLVHSEDIQINEFTNMAWLNHSKWAYDLVDAFKDKTILCIAGGPTLKKHLKTIKDNQDKFVILAVSTVAELLFKEGITPHIIGTIDMKSLNKLYLEALTKEQMDSSHLLFEIDTHHKVVDAYTGPKIMMVADINRAPGTMCMTKELNLGFDFPKSGTVSNMIYNFARMLGPKQIILAGYDLCYTGSNSHIDGVRTGEGLQVIQNQNGNFIQFGNSNSVEQAIPVETWAKNEDGTNKVAWTTKAYYTYLVEIQLRIRDAKIPTYDIDEDSTKKELAELINFEELVAKLPVMDINPHDVIKAMPTKKLRNNTVKHLLRNPLKGDNKADIRYNHVTKLVYFMKQYNMYPLLKFGNVMHDFEMLVINATKGALEKIVNTAEEKWRKLNEEEQNG
ncbi:MAG: 6-hydroxymethylpterin diphosphokinase MptE-like protein [Candidatus Neomarinimicrobiota bacterium]